MIIEYHRPKTLEEALQLLARTNPPTFPLGGGTVLNQPLKQEFAVVDVQALGLDQVAFKGKTLEIGAAVKLQTLLERINDLPALAKAIRHQAGYNLRNMATVAGTLAAADGRSPFAVAMMALNAQLAILKACQAEGPQSEVSGLGDLLPLRPEALAHGLIKTVAIPLNVQLAYEYIARTPADLPVVCAAVAQWPSGRTRVVLGGFGESPLLAMDGPQPDGAEIAAQDAYRHAGDQWASAEYRREMAAVLTGRCIESLKVNG